MDFMTLPRNTDVSHDLCQCFRFLTARLDVDHCVFDAVKCQNTENVSCQNGLFGIIATYKER